MIDPTLNPLEVIVVSDKLKELGITDFDMRRGNNCIHVSHGLVESYYIFKAGQLVDIQYD